MKYNEELFNMSKELFDNMVQTDVDDKTKKMQDELLLILLERLKEESQGRQLEGILPLRFKDRFYSFVDEGYKQISYLVSTENFDTFASQYCIYMGEIETRCDENCSASYYEIIWDYKTYFETLSIIQILKDLDSPDSIQKLLKSWEDFKQLPKEYQIKTLESFKNKVNKCKREIKREVIINTCLTEGHQFDSWNKKTWMEKRQMGDWGHLEWVDFECAEWKRTCKRCGFTETVDKEPEELVRERKEQKRKARIKELETELARLKKV